MINDKEQKLLLAKLDYEFKGAFRFPDYNGELNDEFYYIFDAYIFKDGYAMLEKLFKDRIQCSIESGYFTFHYDGNGVYRVTPDSSTAEYDADYQNLHGDIQLMFMNKQLYYSSFEQKKEEE